MERSLGSRVRVAGPPCRIAGTRFLRSVPAAIVSEISFIMGVDVLGGVSASSLSSGVLRVLGEHVPDEAGELAGNGNDDLVGRLAAGQQPHRASV